MLRFAQQSHYPLSPLPRPHAYLKCTEKYPLRPGRKLAPETKLTFTSTELDCLRVLGFQRHWDYDGQAPAVHLTLPMEAISVPKAVVWVKLGKGNNEGEVSGEPKRNRISLQRDCY